MLTNPTASWKVVDSKTGVVKEGVYDVKSLEDIEYKKPSDCVKIMQKFQEKCGLCQNGYHALPA